MEIAVGTVRETPITAEKNTKCNALVQSTATLRHRHVPGPYFLINCRRRERKNTRQSILKGWYSPTNTEKLMHVDIQMPTCTVVLH